MTRTELMMDRIRSIRPPHIETRAALGTLGLQERRAMYTTLGALGAGILLGVGATLLVQRLRADEGERSLPRRGPTLDTMERRAEDLEGDSQLVHVLRSR